MNDGVAVPRDNRNDMTAGRIRPVMMISGIMKLTGRRTRAPVGPAGLRKPDGRPQHKKHYGQTKYQPSAFKLSKIHDFSSYVNDNKLL